jgi:hypothetical protein
VTLNGNKLKVNKGEIPAPLQEQCQENGKKGVIKCNYHDLRNAFARHKISAQGLVEPVEIEELGSVVTSKKSDIKDQKGFIEAFLGRLAATLKVSRDDLEASFLGPEAFVVHVAGKRGDDVRHPLPANPDDRSYTPCQLDAVVNGCVDPAYPVSSIVHSCCIGITINHTITQRMTEERFSDRIDALVKRYGFFVSMFGRYEAKPDDRTGKLGEGFIEVSDVVAAVALARDVLSSIPIDATFNADQMLQTTRTLRIQNIARRGRPGGPPLPRINPVLNTVHEIPERIMGNIQELVNRRARGGGNSRWRLDQNYRVLIVPVDEDAELQELLFALQRDDGRRYCISICPDGDEDDLIPEPLFVYHKDNTVEMVGVCRPCVQITLQEALAFFFNPNTRLINQEKMQSIPQRLEPIPTEPSEEEGDQSWPSVPLGAQIFTYMSDRRTLAPYVRAWVTGCAEFAVRSARHWITSCPDHPMFLMKMPKPGENLMCAHGDNMFMCAACSTWHKMDAPCNMNEIPGSKRCPRCKVAVFKISGCNHITCRCGCHWCYKCQAGFDRSDPVYSHMRATHGGIYN